MIEIQNIRLKADAGLGKAIAKIDEVLSAVVFRLDIESLRINKGVLDTANIHFRGGLPEAAAVALMQTKGAAWLSKSGETFFDEVAFDAAKADVIQRSAKFDSAGKRRAHKDIYPHLSDQNIRSFHKLTHRQIHGPARLYRILAANSKAMSDCWVSEAVYHALQNSPDPKDAWRRYLAVWPHWNVNGQFMVYEVKRGETLNVWAGEASSQTNKALPGHHLGKH